MILSIDAGQSSTKIGYIDPITYTVTSFFSEQSEPSLLEERVIALGKSSEIITGVGIAVTHAISRDRQLVFDVLTGKEYLHMQKTGEKKQEIIF